MSSRVLPLWAQAARAFPLALTPLLLTAQTGVRQDARAVESPSVGYDFGMTVAQETMEPGKPIRREPALVARVRTRGPVARVDFLPGTAGTNLPGDWYLTRDLGRTITLVNQKTKSYREVSTVGLREQLVREKGLNVSVSGLVMSVTRDGPCGTIEGWAANCVTVTRRYTAKTRYWIMSQSTDVVETSRLWLSPELVSLGTPFGTFFGSRIELLVRRDSTYIAREREVGRVLDGAGLLRMEVVHTETTGGARAQLTRVISVANVRRSASEDGLFDVPPGYRLELR